MVGQCLTTQWTPTTDPSLGSHDQIRRLHHRLGSQLPGEEHRWSLDTTGERLPHQLSRASDIFPCPKFTCLRGEINLDPSAIGQCNSHCLFEQDGRYSRSLSSLAVQIWEWCIERKITIHAEHLPVKQNVRADWESHHMKDSSDWKLHRGIFLKLLNSCNVGVLAGSTIIPTSRAKSCLHHLSRHLF